jgi:hypothetical protein
MRTFVTVLILLTWSSEQIQALRVPPASGVNLGTYIQAGPLYDPFESDPVLQLRIDDTLKQLVGMRSSDLRNELRKQGLPYKDIVEKRELKKRVASVRVQKALAQEQLEVKDEASKSRRVNDILTEMQKIDSSLSEVDIIHELHERRVKFTGRDDHLSRVRLLALVRLGIMQEGGADSEDVISTASDGEDLVGVRGALRTGFQRRDELVYTHAEKIALDKLNIARKATSSEERRPSVAEAQLNFMAGLDLLSCFDEIREHVRKMDAVNRRDICEFYGITQEGDLEMLSSLVADAVMTERTQRELSSMTEEARASKAYAVDKKDNILNPEAELVDAAKVALLRVTKRVASISQSLMEKAFMEETLEEVSDGIKDATSSIFQATGRGLGSTILIMGCKIAQMLGHLAVGPDPEAANQALFAAAALSIILRRGIASFLGILLCIRVVRTWMDRRHGESESEQKPAAF